MANDYRDRDRDRDRDRGRAPNRGMFGYEGEGYMKGGGDDYEDFARRGYGRDTEADYRTGFAGGYGGRDEYSSGSGRAGWEGGRESRNEEDREPGYRGTGRTGADWPRGSREMNSYRGRSGEMSPPPDRERPQGFADLESSAADRDWNIGRSSEMGHAERPSYRGRGPKNYQRSDERIREDVCERLAMDHDVDASEIEVNVADGVVKLSGSVNERRAKRLTEDIAESVRGVKDVENNIRVSQ